MKRFRQRASKAFVLLLALAMVLSMFPAGALAANPDATQEAAESVIPEVTDENAEAQSDIETDAEDASETQIAVEDASETQTDAETDADIQTEAESALVDAPNYIESLRWNRAGSSTGNTEQLFVRTDEFPYVKPFEFDPEVTEYDLVIPTNMGAGTNLSVVFTDEAKAAGNVYGRVTGIYQTGTETFENKYLYGAAAGEFKAEIPSTSNPGELYFNTYFSANAKCTVQLETGVLTSGEIEDATLEQGRVYTFHVFQSAALRAIEVYYADGTTQVYKQKMAAMLKLGTLPVFAVEDVAAGTESLVLWLLHSSNVLKFDDGSGTGTYETLTVEDTNVQKGDKCTLDLTKYGDSYVKNGVMEIPFMVDHDQETSGANCLDGYYLLKLSFTAVQNSAISPGEASFDKYTPEDVPVTMTLNGNTLSKVTNGTTELIEGTDYIVSDATVTLKKEYLATLDTGSATLTFRFSGGEDQPLTISISDSTPVSPSVHGYLKNIAINWDMYGETVSLLDHFDPFVTSYTIAPRPAISVYGGIRLELADSIDKTAMRYTASLTDADGTEISNTGECSFPDDYDYAALNAQNNVISPAYGNTNYPVQFFNDIPPGEYLLTLRVYEDGHADDADEYSLSLSLYPILYKLSVSAGDVMLPVDPDISGYGSDVDAAAFSTKFYNVEACGNNTITIKGQVWEWMANCNLTPADAALTFVCGGVNSPVTYSRAKLPFEATINLDEFPQENGVITVPFSFVYTYAGKEQRSDYCLSVTPGTDSGWKITGVSGGGTYNKGDTAVVSVTVSGDKADNVFYQWQWSNNVIWSGGRHGDIDGATSSTLTVPTGSSGRRYYRCLVTDKKSGEFQYTEPIQVDVNLGTLNAPIIGWQPGTEAGAKTEYIEGEPIQPIQVTAGTTDMLPQSMPEWASELSIQWYRNDKPAIEGATLIDEANYGKLNQSAKPYPLPSYTDLVDPDIYPFICRFPGGLTVGEHYFFCIVTATAKDDPANTASVTSDILKITVTKRGTIEGLEGNGTEADPYLIKSVDDLKKIDELVMGGDKLTAAVFRFANDITLPADWEPIGGNLAAEKLYLPFSGIIDGDGKTLTYEDGARPLLEWCRDAVVKNLNIYGEKINGAGILEKAGIDYGDDNVYQEDDPDIITVENVTLLSGSRTTGSGLVNGGYTSGINNIFIKNCLIEENVIVGCDRDRNGVGSFVGSLNGRIENSVSYATVYGTRGVGGLAGFKGQSMGLCEIINSAFLGTIEATGGHVGGIIGAGYIDYTAPNTPPVTVRNCYVVADITGNSTPHYAVDTSGGYVNPEGTHVFDQGGGIGGIFGSEIGLMGAWNDAYISDNYFYGTITDTNPDADARYDRVGGIMGELGSFNSHLTYANNYYLSNDNYGGFGYLVRPNEAWNPDQDSFIAKDTSEFANGTVTALLNQGSYKNWVQGENGYPVHGSAAYMTGIELSGDYKTQYYIGDELNTEGMVVTAVWSNGGTAQIDLDAVEFAGYDPQTRGQQKITVSYNGFSAEYTVTVLLPPSGDMISVSFTLYGDVIHEGGEPESDGGPHTLADNNLEIWVEENYYTVDVNATVWDVLLQVMEENGIEAETNLNSGTVYVAGLKKADGEWLREFTNGINSGWMYTLNGAHVNLGVAQQYLEDRDEIIFHYTDDFTLEDHGFTPCSHEWDEGTVTKEPTCTEKGVKTYTCSKCGLTATEEIKPLGHSYDEAGFCERCGEFIFTDVVGSKSQKYVSWSYQNGIVKGMAENTFAPDEGCSRIQFIMMLWKMNGSKTVKGVENPFSDITGSKTVKAVKWALKEGIINSADTFDPDGEITRAQIVMILYKLAGSPKVNTTDNPFTDVTGNKLTKAVLWAKSKDITKGTSDTTFSPEDPCTRIQLVVFLYKYNIKYHVV